MKAIETHYKGYRFRSRLEARWAVFFDALGIGWEYEPQGYDLGSAGLYLPDFRLSRAGLGMFIEIKPDRGATADEKAKYAALSEACQCPVLLFAGLPPTNFEQTGLGWYEYFPADGYANGLAVTLCNCRKCSSLVVYSDGWGGIGTCTVMTCPDGGLGCLITNRAAGAARSARFEYGETPS
jgi:hypothetical protein